VFHCRDCGESLWGKKLRAFIKEVNDGLQNNRR
jgi:hypothetical protein